MKVTGLLSYIRPVDEATASGLDETFAHIVLNAYTALINSGQAPIPGFRYAGLTCFSSFLLSTQCWS
ncbi:TPA: hypothetical protein ACS62C_005910, partial [Klebsiella pneumoniae]|jgi:hypothetical protein